MTITPTRTNALRRMASAARAAVAELWHQVLDEVHRSTISKHLLQTRLTLDQNRRDIHHLQRQIGTHHGTPNPATQAQLADLLAWQVDLERQAMRLRNELLGGPN